MRFTFILLASACIAVPMLQGCGGSSTPPVANTLGATAQRPADSSSQYRVLSAFTKLDGGVHPASGLIDVNGTLYGTTSGGGDSNCPPAPFCGTVYSMTLDGVQHVLYKFKGGSDGERPMAKLLNVKGTLYGTTSRGGGNGCQKLGCGTVFSVSLNGSERVLYRFGGVSDGATPEAGLTDVDGVLYGTTEFGGLNDCNASSPGCGTVFSVTTAGNERVLHRFSNSPDGGNPVAGLIEAGGILYGTTRAGGTGYGTVFRITPKGPEKIVHRFQDSPDGAYPEAQLTYVGSGLYGTTSAGGGFSQGTVFRIGENGDDNIVYDFKSSSSRGYGDNVDLPLTYDHGKFYVASQRGGEGKCFDQCGVLYSITVHGQAQILHEFTGGSDGCLPSSGLLQVNGTLYGATTLGGRGGNGCSQVGPGGTIYTLIP